MPSAGHNNAGENWHLSSDPTHAVVCAKLSASNGHLLQTSSEAGSILPETWPTAGEWDIACINLGKLLGSAQGGAVRRETMHTPTAKRRRTRGARDDAVPEKDLASMSHTNVFLLFLQQVTVFSEWWALQEKRKHVGLSHRFLFSFGCSGPTPETFSSRFRTSVFGKSLCVGFRNLRPASTSERIVPYLVCRNS